MITASAASRKITSRFHSGWSLYQTPTTSTGLRLPERARAMRHDHEHQADDDHDMYR